MGATSSKAKKRDSGSVAPYSDPPQKKTQPKTVSDIPGELAAQKPKPLVPVMKKEPSSTGWAVNTDAFNHDYTEGQCRRDLVATCEDECSEITDFLFVGAAKVAKSKHILQSHRITRIVNLAPSAVPNYFESDDMFTYLTIDMLDGRQDDISWFLCEVIQFVEVGRYTRQHTLLHCEKGVSRSCAMAIAYIMWASESNWKEAFEYVKCCRASCAPNTGFTCNLIEIGDMLHGESRNSPMFFRCASHLPTDSRTPVLKLVRSEDSRKVILPRSSFLHSDGVFVIRPATGDSKVIFVWKGRNASAECLRVVCMLAQQMMGVFCDSTVIELVDDGAEPMDFLDHLIIDGEMDTRCQYHFNDLFVCTNETVTQVKRRRSLGAATTLRKSFKAAGPAMCIEDAESEYPIKTTATTSEDDAIPVAGDKIIVEERVISGFMAKPEAMAPSPSISRQVNKRTLVLKHTLSMDRSSTDSVAVERPTIKNLTSTSLVDAVQELESESRAAVASPGAPIQSQEKVRPRLFLCTQEDSSTCLWQACGVYDDDDLGETSLLFLHCGDGNHFLWVGREFSMLPGGEKDDGEVRSVENTGGVAVMDTSAESHSAVYFAMTSVSAGDLGPEFKTLLQHAVVVRQGEEDDLFWDKFYEGSGPLKWRTAK